MTSVETSLGFDLIQVRIESLSSKMDTLISIQEKVLSRLDSMSEELVGIERDMETLKVDKEEMPPASCNKGPARGTGGEMKEMCQEMNSIMTAVNKRSEQQTQKLEGMERLVMSIQQVVGFIGETVKTSRITELMFKGPAARKSKATLACKNQDSKHGVKRQASGEPVPGKVSQICSQLSKHDLFFTNSHFNYWHTSQKFYSSWYPGLEHSFCNAWVTLECIKPTMTLTLQCILKISQVMFVPYIFQSSRLLLESASATWPTMYSS